MRILGAVVMAASLFLLLRGFSGTVDAAPCTGLYGNFHVGYRGYDPAPASWHETPEGVKASIKVRSPYTCTPQAGYFANSTAWVMLYGNTYDRYAQAGYLKQPTVCAQRFYQWRTPTSGGSVTGLRGGCLSNGTILEFSVFYSGPAGPWPSCSFDIAMTAQGYGVIADTESCPGVCKSIANPLDQPAFTKIAESQLRTLPLPPPGQSRATHSSIREAGRFDRRTRGPFTVLTSSKAALKTS